MEIITLTDPSGSSAKIVAGYGFNCFSFQTVHGGKPHEVLWSAPNFEKGKERPSHSGIPILFPFPGRIRGNAFTFEGRDYRVNVHDDGRGNAIHGFVLNRPWEVIQQTRNRAVGRFQASRVDPTILDQWPSDFRLLVSYELVGNALVSEISVENPGERNLPFGLGTHAYFRLPLAEGSQAGACRVTVPAAAYWEMKDMLPTGRVLPVDEAHDLRGGMPFEQTRLDDMLTQLQFEGDRVVTSIHDPIAQRTMELSFDRGFRECVVYNPPHRQAICIEPYTSVPDPYTLTAQGIDAGLKVLAPGETFLARVAIELL
jgi:aldose 1-epimerase